MDEDEKPRRKLVTFVEEFVTEGIVGPNVGALVSSGGLTQEALFIGVASHLASRVGKALFSFLFRARANVLSDYMPELERRARLLGEKHPEDDVKNYARATGEAWSATFDSTADPRKQKVAAAALVNAFLPEIFEEGLALRLFTLLDDLDYGELFLLCQVMANRPFEGCFSGQRAEEPERTSPSSGEPGRGKG